MLAYFVRRILTMVPTLIAISFIVFVIHIRISLLLLLCISVIG